MPRENCIIGANPKPPRRGRNVWALSQNGRRVISSCKGNFHPPPALVAFTDPTIAFRCLRGLNRIASRLADLTSGPYVFESRRPTRRWLATAPSAKSRLGDIGFI